jgi:hypothetical protein
LKPQEGGNYAALVESECREAFMTMHTSRTHNEAGKRIGPLLDGSPTPNSYEVVMG